MEGIKSPKKLQSFWLPSSYMKIIYTTLYYSIFGVNFCEWLVMGASTLLGIPALGGLASEFPLDLG